MGRLQPSACSQTIAASLEGCGSTIELYPQIKRLARPRSLSFTGRLLSYRGDRRDCLVFSGAFRKRVNPQPCRTAQNDSQTCSAAWEIAGRCVPESSREHDMTQAVAVRCNMNGVSE